MGAEYKGQLKTGILTPSRPGVIVALMRPLNPNLKVLFGSISAQYGLVRVNLYLILVLTSYGVKIDQVKNHIYHNTHSLGGKSAKRMSRIIWRATYYFRNVFAFLWLIFSYLRLGCAY